MIFVVVAVWACCFAEERANLKSVPVTRFLPPWNIPQVEVADNCTMLCARWNELYFSDDYGCVGRDDARIAHGDDSAATTKLSFCPDKTAIRPWTVDEELEFEAVYLISGELEQSELDVFNELTVEREMKLSVNPWHMLLQEEFNVPQDRRRATLVDGSSTDWSCFGGNGGGAIVGHQSSRPTHLIVRHGNFINRVEFSFARHRFSGMFGYEGVRGGGTGGDVTYTALPDCITYIFIRAGRYVDALRFFGDADHTPYLGGYGGADFALFAPSDKCLGGIRIKTGSLVDKICFLFNYSK